LLTPAEPAVTEIKTFARLRKLLAKKLDPGISTTSRRSIVFSCTPDCYQAFPDLAESQWIAKQKTATLPEAKTRRTESVLLDPCARRRRISGRRQNLPEVVKELHRANLSALCFSGGGIRSATSASA